MRILVRSLLVIGAVALLAVAPSGVALGQAGLPGQPEQQPGQQPEQPQRPGQESGQQAEPGRQADEGAQEELTLEGEISSVDVDAMTITLIGDDGMELQFSYDAQTEVEGEPEGVQGLTGQTGTRARVSYHAVEDTAVAHRIELLEGEEPLREEEREQPGLEGQQPEPGDEPGGGLGR